MAEDAEVLSAFVRNVEEGKSVVTNPSFTIGDKTITFPVVLKPGDSILFKPPDDCSLIDSEGKTQPVKPQGEAPALKPGANEASFRTSDGILVNEISLSLMRM